MYYLEGRVTERERYCISYFSLSGCRSWDWARLGPGAGNASWSLPWVTLRSSRKLTQKQSCDQHCSEACEHRGRCLSRLPRSASSQCLVSRHMWPCSGVIKMPAWVSPHCQYVYVSQVRGLCLETVGTRCTLQGDDLHCGHCAFITAHAVKV